MRRYAGATAVAVLAVAGVLAQEPVTFRTYQYKVGDKTRTTQTDDGTTATTISAGGKEQKKDEKVKKTVVYVTEVLAVGADPRKPAKVRRTYEKAVETKGGVEAKLPLDGLVVTAEKKGEKYVFTLADGTAPAGAAAAELDKAFNKKGGKEEDFFPKGGVKVGESWDLTDVLIRDAAADASQFTFDKAGAKATGKLLAVDKKDGVAVGTIAVTATMPLAELKGKNTITLAKGSRMSLDMTGTGSIDGSAPVGQMTGRTRMLIDGEVNGVRLKVTADVTQTTKTERVK